MKQPLDDVPADLRGWASFWLDAFLNCPQTITTDNPGEKNIRAMELLAQAGWIDLSILTCGSSTACRLSPAMKLWPWLDQNGGMPF